MTEFFNQSDFKLSFPDGEQSFKESLSKLYQDNIVQRIWKHDHTVWKNSPDEIANRLGWLHSPETMKEAVSEIVNFVNEVRNGRFTHALLLGMGGSSLAPEVFRYTFGVKTGYLDLSVLDSTHPSEILHLSRMLDPKTTLYIVSTKSGGTVETLSFMKYFYNQVLEVAGEENTGKHFVAITDPGSSLEEKAKELNFKKIFFNDPNIGGRYSALSYFGLVPAGLIGVDLSKLLLNTERMAQRCKIDSEQENIHNPGVLLGAILGEFVKRDRDKLTLIAPPEISFFSAWVEQLIAESTGKEGTGILPVDGESVESPESYSNDRVFVYSRIEGDTMFDQKVKHLSNAGHPVMELKLKDHYDIGAEFFRWEMATVVASIYLKINPFDQPNVESAKIIARQMVTAYQKEGKLPEIEPTIEDTDIQVFSLDPVNKINQAFNSFFSHLNTDQHDRGYVSIQAYLQPTSEIDILLQKLRLTIQKKYAVATTIGYGPRFLHSTGQLHKGDNGKGLFIQFTENIKEEVPIPDEAGSKVSSIGFGVLILAQALGDMRALIDEGRQVIRFHLKGSPSRDLGKIIELLD